MTKHSEKHQEAKLDIIQSIVDFNEIGGNTFQQRHLSHPLVQRYKDLIEEEYDEWKKAKTLEDKADGACDILTVVAGYLYSLGIHPQEAMEIVCKSNLSKFPTSLEEAEATVDQYHTDPRYKDLHYTKLDDDLYVVKGRKQNDPYNAAYKILKSINYAEADFKELTKGHPETVKADKKAKSLEEEI